MRIKLNDEVIDIRAIWLDNKDLGIVKMIDQRLLPFQFKIFESRTVQDTAWAIKNMVTRGAPNIGVAGAYGIYQATVEAINKDTFPEYVFEKAQEIMKTRPTAVNLFNVVKEVLDFLQKKLSEGLSKDEILDALYKKVESIANREVEANRRIGEIGKKLIRDGDNILTHCNAGALAAVDIGTALAPIRFAYYEGKNIRVYVDETRPWLQGARLTAWELEMEGIPYYLIPDNTAGWLIQRRDVDLIIVGADRIAMNGDVANKIGTYKLAVLAKENGIPFYVAAPLTTFDPNIATGDEIPIEERSPEEVIYVLGYDEETKKLKRVRIAPENSRVLNPVFDVTPFKYIDGIITEVGILREPQEIERAVKALRSSATQS
ncbi:MAG: S-methyl-5-thioribose-1-phosphate isomerase [Candidatus Njordarchaeales archaeon]